MNNTSNSFTDTVNNLIKQTNISLSLVAGLNNSMTAQNDTVNVEINTQDSLTGDSSIITVSIPSYATTLNKLNAIQSTVDTFVKGNGKILLNDGSYREIKTSPVAISPTTITNVDIPAQFSTQNNWFFESLLYPKLVVSFDLKGKINNRSDRIIVKRVIFNNSSDTETQWFKDNIINKDLSYYDVITLLNENNKKYWEDDENIQLPLSTKPYTGKFLITDKQTIDGKRWYYLDNLNYGIPSDEYVVKNIPLSVGDQLRYNNAIYKIDDIVLTEKRIHLIPILGIDHPITSNYFEIYSTPFSSKIVKIPIGHNECNAIFIKGVNDDFNIIADEWSNAISFYTNDLIMSESSMTLDEYYNKYVIDFGKTMEGNAKERFIPAYNGISPDSPNLESSNFSVSQINKQINASLDTNSIINTQAQIETAKTTINSLKQTIAHQKSDLVNITNPADRTALNNNIELNINKLSNASTEYQSLVQSLSTIAYDNNMVKPNPKYRIRGFFNIPDGKKLNTYDKVQEIIQFEIAYRYLKLDGTGNPLDTYEHKDSSTGLVTYGVFSDWNIYKSSVKSKVYDSSSGTFIWVSENISDGSKVNINQVDIPIHQGERVEFKVRSISEAGWPINSLKSEWSNSVIIDFPSNLLNSDQVSNILSGAITEENAIQLNNTLSASGVTTHMSDSIPNPNSGNGTYFKHQAVNIAYNLKNKSINNDVLSISTIDLQSKLDNITSKSYVTLTRPLNANIQSSNITGTLQQFMQAIVNIDPSIYDEFYSIINAQ